ncbi:MAG: queG [Dehalococcoidia bacterium]|nr:queG [Dehalococcoidia bacterium]
MSLARRLKEYAAELGFGAVGVTSAQNFLDTEEVLLDRIAGGLMDGLPWFTPQRARLSCRPQELLPGARSVVALAASYLTQEQEIDKPEGHRPRGRLARYAQGEDYHDVLKERLRRVVQFVARELGYTPGFRLFVDSSPLPEREVARRAGVGWFGKNTNLLVPGLGSWAFLSAIILDVELEEDVPLAKNCGSCNLCIEACPTNALIDPYILDNSKCISYLTIENKGNIPKELREPIGDWVFGCDICQEVCPVNRKALPIGWDEFNPRPTVGSNPLLLPILEMDNASFRETSMGSPVRRAKLRGMQRNATVALGNIGDPDVVLHLGSALESNGEPIVRSHAAWALGRIGGRRARRSLEKARQGEIDPDARREIEEALECISKL